jgi:hypothetical protein
LHSWYFPNRTEANQDNHQGAASKAFHGGNDGRCLQGQIDTGVATQTLLDSILSYGEMRYHQHAGIAFSTVTHVAGRLFDKEGMTDDKYYCDTEQEE